MKDSNIPLRRVLRFAACALGTMLVIEFLVARGGVFPLLEAGPAQSSGAEVAVSAEAAESAAEKLRQIQEVSDSGAAGLLTEFSESEVNSYLAYEMAPRYPAGVSNVQLHFLPGRIHGTSVVDFDKAKAARQAPGGMSDYLFWGVHNVAAEGGFSAIDGVGQFDLESVAIDEVAIPRTAVDLLIQTFLKPRFPRLALNTPFYLPRSVDRVQVMRGSIVVEVNPARPR